MPIQGQGPVPYCISRHYQPASYTAGALGDSSHKTVELSAQAEEDAREPWRDAQATFYRQLGEQLEGLWASKANGQPANGSSGTNNNGNGSIVARNTA